MTAAQLLERARDALDRDDLTGAYLAVLAAWRAHRADPLAALVHDLEPKLPPRPRLAAMAWSHWTGIESARDPLDVSRQVRFLRDQDETAWLAGLTELAKRDDDPTLARTIASILRHQPWELVEHNQKACELVARGAGGAELAWLREACAIAGAHLLATLHTTLTMIEARPKLDPALEPLVTAFADAEARRVSRHTFHVVRASDLLAEVYANLDDDGPRLALADHLMERGDPRGELIALQCQRTPLTPKQHKRVKRLVENHGLMWLADMGADIVQADGLVFERGFVASCRVRLGATRARSVGDPIWATVREVTQLVDRPARELLDPVCASLRTVWGLNAPTCELIESPLPLERVGFSSGNHAMAFLARQPRIFPNVREVRCSTRPDDPRLVEAFIHAHPLDRLWLPAKPTTPWRALLGPQLRELVFSHHDARFVVTRDAPTELYMELPLHGWERLQRRDFPIYGVSKIRLRRPHNACAACLSATIRDADLPRVFGCEVELV